MNYKTELTASMQRLAADPLTRFVGYGLLHGRALGTLRDVPDAQIVETTVAENLMAGMATGMAIAGLRPVVYFERFDFVLNAADAIVNHLDKLATISRGEFRPGVILRVTVGNRTKPLFTGETHTQDLSEAFATMLTMPVLPLRRAEEIAPTYDYAASAQRSGQSTMIVEYKDLI